ncbi:hypothetical protein HYPSUDRAFT_68182 [Hypholoma sublateritium FD-334 SS-4]|uniref:Uncharacterized protein n=1 Tax=Hypholoma sublateritium (strain FD-334 SS-4) TaxID=945553 RepID=A0A0D2NWI6_HYPSF|nr:hypothetical protein HYPSUDRAFT_68182 [Hypholoma sublateritium FD-334 SS-4]
MSKKPLIFIFPVFLALAVKYMYMDHLEAGVDQHIAGLCSRSGTFPKHVDFRRSYSRNYTGIFSIDTSDPGPCAVVAFFHLLLDAPTIASSRFLTYLLGTGIPCILVPFVEGYRYAGRQHALLRWPTLWLLMTQAATMALTFPLYFSLLLFSREGPKESTGEGAKDIRAVTNASRLAHAMKPGQAQALLLGLIVGAVIPSAAMVLANDAWVTWGWQFYPIYIALVRDLYLYIQGPPEESPRTHRLTKTSYLWVIYLGAFGVAAVTHAWIVWPLILVGDFTALQNLLVPLVASSALDMHPSQQGHNFLKWDYLLGSLCVATGLLCATGSYRQARKMFMWCVFAVPIFGFGGAIAGILVWRDLLPEVY